MILPCAGTIALAYEEMGGEVRLETRVDKIELEGDRVVAVHADGERIEPRDVISSLPLRDTVRMADPAAPEAVRKAGSTLRYRDFLTVALVIDGEDPFPAGTPTAQQHDGRFVEDDAATDVAQNVEMMRRTAGEIVAARQHDARVMPVLDPAAPRPGVG